MTWWLWALIGLLAGLGGSVWGYWGAKNAHKQIKEEKKEEEQRLRAQYAVEAEARVIKEVASKELELNRQMREQERALETREKALSERESLCKEREQKISSQLAQLKEERANLTADQERLKGNLRELKRQQQSNEDRKRHLENREEQVTALEKEMNSAREEQLKELERIAELTTEEAKEQLKEKLLSEAEQETLALRAKVLDNAERDAEREAKNVIIKSIQRLGVEPAIMNSTVQFRIASEDMKRSIIGRGGRNIQAFKSATGVDLVVDDTPGAVMISCFDNVRREVARMALHELVHSKKISPGYIEQVVAKVRREVERDIIEVGKRTVLDLGVQPMAPKLAEFIGRMKYRSSYGQNLLHHSREVAMLCANMASELGLDVRKAKRAGLLHDIGKVVSDQQFEELSHALSGMQLAEQYGESADVCNAIGAHHFEIEMATMIAPVVQVCDAISGARPGARREDEAGFIKRLQDMEDLAKRFKGVHSAFATQAGRDFRVVVDSEKVSDEESKLLSIDIAKKIESELRYPGQVRVTVIREVRNMSVAR